MWPNQHNWKTRCWRPWIVRPYKDYEASGQLDRWEWDNWIELELDVWPIYLGNHKPTPDNVEEWFLTPMPPSILTMPLCAGCAGDKVLFIFPCYFLNVHNVVKFYCIQ